MGGMGSSSDTFAVFVAVLSDALNDHEADGAELARRVGLSRFHFDRVIAAAAGEPPARLRRRVLLERAAYRLVTTRHPVLEVAVEAGYSSHEAFTRAFLQAYAAAPAQWRHQPTRIQLPAPNGVHFHPPGSLRLLGRPEATSMNLTGPANEQAGPAHLLTRMVDHHIWLVGEMLHHATTLSDERLDAPIEISVTGIDPEPTLRSLLGRLVMQLEMWNSAIGGASGDAGDGDAIAQLQARLAQVGPAFLEQVRDACDEGRLDDTLVCPGEPVTVYTFGGVIAHVLTYAAHRRTLVAGALHDAGITDLADDPIEWVAASR